jgi:hypothetical protein
LTSINDWIIWVRYSLLMNGLEMPMVNFLPSGAAVGCPAGAEEPYPCVL